MPTRRPQSRSTAARLRTRRRPVARRCQRRRRRRESLAARSVGGGAHSELAGPPSGVNKTPVVIMQLYSYTQIHLDEFLSSITRKTCFPVSVTSFRFQMPAPTPRQRAAVIPPASDGPHEPSRPVTYQYGALGSCLVGQTLTRSSLAARERLPAPYTRAPQHRLTAYWSRFQPLGRAFTKIWRGFRCQSPPPHSLPRSPRRLQTGRRGPVDQSLISLTRWGLV